MTVTIVTAGDFNYRDIMQVSQERALRFGYEMIVYDLGGVGFGREFAVDGDSFSRFGMPFPSCLHKPKVVKDCLGGLPEGAHLLYLDADAVLNAPIDGAFGGFDVGVTLRRQGWVGKGPCPRFTGYIQAGVLFFVNNRETRGFVDRWDEATAQYKCDQRALNEMIDPHTDWRSYDVVVEADGVRVKIFRTDEYNFFYFGEGYSDKNKVLHFKAEHRKHFRELLG